MIARSALAVRHPRGYVAPGRVGRFLHEDNRAALSLAKRELERIREPATLVGGQHQAVQHEFDRDLSSEVAKETREIDAKIGEFVERKVTAEDQLKRVDIRAPHDGTIFQSTVHTVAGVLNA